MDCKVRNVLIIVAHPDDEVLGMGGTIAKMHNSGDCISLLIVTDGSTAQYRNCENLNHIIDNKKKETEKAAKVLGIDKIIYGELPDMQLDSIKHIKINEIIEKAISEIKPEVIFTHFYGDVNVDHQEVYKSVLVAARPTCEQCVKEIYLFDVPSSTEWSPQLPDTVFMPNYYVDISKSVDLKYKAMQAYEEELREFPHPRSIEYLKKVDLVAGLKVGVGAAETFMMIRKID